MIYWIDSQWVFPPPAIAPVGSRHPLTTLLTRQTDHSPLAGWVVRYEIAGGPDAGFGPDGSPAIEVVSSETGEATAEIFQKAGTAGSNQINIQVIRPAGSGGPTRQVAVGNGSTSVNWTATDLTLRTTGPAQAAVGAIATYRIEVTNPAPTAIHGVVVTDQAPPGLSFLNSNPAAGSSPSGQEWQIGDLGPQQSQVIEVNFRVDQPGSLNYYASFSAASGQTAKGARRPSSPLAAPSEWRWSEWRWSEWRWYRCWRRSCCRHWSGCRQQRAVRHCHQGPRGRRGWHRRLVHDRSHESGQCGRHRRIGLRPVRPRLSACGRSQSDRSQSRPDRAGRDSPYCGYVPRNPSGPALSGSDR